MHSLGVFWLKAVLRKKIHTGFAFPYSGNSRRKKEKKKRKFSLQIDLFANVLLSVSIYNKQAAETLAPGEAGGAGWAELAGEGLGATTLHHNPWQSTDCRTRMRRSHNSEPRQPIILPDDSWVLQNRINLDFHTLRRKAFESRWHVEGGCVITMADTGRTGNHDSSIRQLHSL